MEKLPAKIVETNGKSQRYRISALQANRSNPHFLYNVIDNVNWMARKKGEENICRMVNFAIGNVHVVVLVINEVWYV